MTEELNPIQKILKRKALADGKCELCKTELGIRTDYLCPWCRSIKNMENLSRPRPNDIALKCSSCGKVLSKEDKELSKILKELICWKCKKEK